MCVCVCLLSSEHCLGWDVVLCCVQRPRPHRLARPHARLLRDSERHSSTTVTSQTPREASSPPSPPPAAPPIPPLPPLPPPPSPLQGLRCSATTISSVIPPIPAASATPATREDCLEARALGALRAFTSHALGNAVFPCERLSFQRDLLDISHTCTCTD